MLLALLAAAAVQTALPAPPPQTKAPDAQLQQRLACQKPERPIPVGQTPKSSLHVLGAEPDAHMLRPVVRNYCNDNDVVRYFVTQMQPASGPQRQGR